MKNDLHYSPEAQRDLDAIWDYIASELCSPHAAENTVNGILDAIDRLEDFAEIGAPLSSVTEVESDYRFLISRSYMIFYRIEEKDIYIDRILYGRRNYLRILFPDLPQDNNRE